MALNDGIHKLHVLQHLCANAPVSMRPLRTPAFFCYVPFKKITKVS